MPSTVIVFLKLSRLSDSPGAILCTGGDKVARKFDML